MEERTLALPEIALIAGTRVALGIGVGLLLAQKLAAGARKKAGLALVSLGALSTIPLAFRLFRKQAAPAL
ncbi:MAG TPA: hypothetical protein VND93_16130 [Myxococcales bacterium]|jgi:hypothetical protein|nr:hypothetical protein [Myxococcales bacterium]